jgi:hypothetical protein
MGNSVRIVKKPQGCRDRLRKRDGQNPGQNVKRDTLILRALVAEAAFAKA